ncbi:MAG: hypothetical protein DVB31_06005 [Verrucomicrobia bacterium]|nr:MAG: hypothetical protein DVB31_06005 [Verrucomicrobiota bacterium]
MEHLRDRAAADPGQVSGDAEPAGGRGGDAGVHPGRGDAGGDCRGGVGAAPRPGGAGRKPGGLGSGGRFAGIAGSLRPSGGGDPGDREVPLTDLFGVEATRLTRHPALDGLPAWSPDGQRLAPASGGDAERLRVSPGDNLEPSVR